MPQWALFIVDSQVGQGYKLLGASIETSRTASAASAVGESLERRGHFLCYSGGSLYEWPVPCTRGARVSSFNLPKTDM